MPENYKERLRKEWAEFNDEMDFTSPPESIVVADYWLEKLETQIQCAVTAEREKINSLEFKMSVDEYLPLVEQWNKTDFDIPFDHGYAQAKKDILLLLTPTSNKN